MGNLGQQLLVPARGKSGGLPITAGLVAWYSADKITGLNNGDPVASWPDSSGNGNTASQATQSQRLTYHTNVQNGLPGAQSDGVDDGMASPSITIATAPFSAFMVFKPVGFAVGTNYRLAGFGGTVPFKWRANGGAGGNWVVDFGVASPAGAAGSVVDGQTVVLLLSYDGATATIYVNGTPGTSNPVNTTISSAPYQFGNFQTNTPGYYFEHGIYLTSLSATQISQVSHYLGSKWGVAVS